MSSSPNKRAVIVGLFVFFGIVFFVAAILMIGSLKGTFKKRIQVVSYFDDVNGLQAGNNVWFSGVKIGTVNKLNFFGSSQVEVILNIDVKSQEYIRKDAMVKISTDGLIGNKILVIYDGTDRAREIQEGDTLGVEKTFSSEDMINTLQKNNENILAITTDFKTISKSLAEGEGSIGKLLNESSLYDDLSSTVASLQATAQKANTMSNSLNKFTANLNKEGTLANELATDTIVFNSMKSSILELQKASESAALMIQELNAASTNPNTPMGTILHDEIAGENVKYMLQNLERSTFKLDENMEALQHNFLFRGFFKRRDKSEKKAAEAEEKAAQKP